jgi:hypothetical protein
MDARSSPDVAPGHNGTGPVPAAPSRWPRSRGAEYVILGGIVLWVVAQALPAYTNESATAVPGWVATIGTWLEAILAWGLGSVGGGLMLLVAWAANIWLVLAVVSLGLRRHQAALGFAILAAASSAVGMWVLLSGGLPDGGPIETVTVGIGSFVWFASTLVVLAGTAYWPLPMESSESEFALPLLMTQPPRASGRRDRPPSEPATPQHSTASHTVGRALLMPFVVGAVGTFVALGAVFTSDLDTLGIYLLIEVPLASGFVGLLAGGASARSDRSIGFLGGLVGFCVGLFAAEFAFYEYGVSLFAFGFGLLLGGLPFVLAYGPGRVSVRYLARH